MIKEENHLIRNCLNHLDNLIESSGTTMAFQRYRYIRDYAFYCKAIGKSIGIHRDEYQLPLLAILIYSVSEFESEGNSLSLKNLVTSISEIMQLNESEIDQINYYLQFLKSEEGPKNEIENVVLDTMYIHLGLPGALEWLALRRLQLETREAKRFTELEWENYCHNYFLKHCFYTSYVKDKYGTSRSKNFTEIEKRIEKLEVEQNKLNKDAIDDYALSDKEGENLFKIAFRNYLNLVGLADRKAHLLIQVNAILASVIIGFTIKRAENSSYYVLPTAMILIIAALTIFYSILASKPLGKFKDFASQRESFFFGSFDRIDPDFKNVTWDKYFSDIKELFQGNKEMVFNELIKESYQVRKVLAKKFGFLAIAYKVFIIGQLSAISFFLVMLLLRK